MKSNSWVLRVDAIRYLLSRMEEETEREQFDTTDAINCILATFTRSERKRIITKEVVL